MQPSTLTRDQCANPVPAILVAFILLPFETASDALAIPLAECGASTLYVQVDVAGAGNRDFLVDTGSSYSCIGTDTLDALEVRGMATFVGRVGGTMAAGSRRYVPICSIDGLTVGDRCRLDDVELAVLPGRERPILGVNALRRLAPITFSMDAPRAQAGAVSRRHPGRRADRLRGPLIASRRDGAMSRRRYGPVFFALRVNSIVPVRVCRNGRVLPAGDGLAASGDRSGLKP